MHKNGHQLMRGPKVTTLEDHNTVEIGHSMYVVKKLPEIDQTVIIKDDVWIEMCVTISKDATARRRTIVAVGAIAAKSPLYSTCRGCQHMLLNIDCHRHDQLLGYMKGR